MKAIAINFLSHLVASVICLAIFTLTPIVLYGILVIVGIIFFGDMGGRLNFILVPLLSVVWALVTTFIILLPITAIIQWVLARLKLSKWTPLLTIFPASFMAFVSVIFTTVIIKPNEVLGTLVFLAAWCLVGSACFALYWIPLSLSETFLNGVWRFVALLVFKLRLSSS